MTEQELLFNLEQVLKGRAGNGHVNSQDIQDLISKSQAKVTETNNQIRSLCAKNYTEFLQTLECTQTLKSAIDSINQNVGLIHTRIDLIDAHYYKDAQELEKLNQEADQISHAKQQLELGKKFIVRLDRCEKSVASSALQGAMRESTLIMQEILKCDLPIKFREAVTQKCDKIHDKIKEQLQKQLHIVHQQIQSLELQVGLDSFDNVQSGLSMLGLQFMLEPDLQPFQRESVTRAKHQKSTMKAPPRQSTQRLSKMRQSLSNEDFLNEMDEMQEVMYEDDVDASDMATKTAKQRDGEGTFTNAAIQRQVNYISEIPIDIDYLMLDRLNKLYEQAKKLGIMSSLVKDELKARRFERLVVLCKELELGQSQQSINCKSCQRTQKLCQDCQSYEKGSGENFYIDTLRRLAGFFVIQSSMTYNLSHMFTREILNQLWDSALISVKKAFELAMKLSNYEDMLQLKKTMLVFCLSMQDLGITNESENQQAILVKLQDYYLEKMCDKIRDQVQILLKQENYVPVEVKNDQEFNTNVEKFEFELFEFFRQTNKITGIQLKNYPLTLPYSKSVVTINNTIATYIESLMDYWQFLLTEVSEFTLVTASCEQMISCVREEIQRHIQTEVITNFTVLQQAQVCQDLEYFIRSIPFYKRLIVRRATLGTGKLNVGGFDKWFKIDVQKEFLQSKDFTMKNINLHLTKKLKDVMSEVESESWTPKESLRGHTLYHSHMDDFKMFFGTAIVPLARYNADLASQQAEEILKKFCRDMIMIAGKNKINLYGLINLWLDYLALSEFVVECQKSEQLHVGDTIGMGSMQKTLRINEESILELKVVSEFMIGHPDSYDAIEMSSRKQTVTQLIELLISQFKEEKFQLAEGIYPKNIAAKLQGVSKIKMKGLKAQLLKK